MSPRGLLVVSLIGCSAAPCLGTASVRSTTTTRAETEFSWAGWYGLQSDREAPPSVDDIQYVNGALVGYGMGFALFLPTGELCALIDGQSSFILPGEVEAGLAISTSAEAGKSTSTACGSGVIRELPTYGSPNGVRVEYDSGYIVEVLSGGDQSSGDTHAAGAVGYGATYTNVSRQPFVYYTAAYGEMSWVHTVTDGSLGGDKLTSASINNNPNASVIATVDSESFTPGDQVLVSCGAGPECFGPEFAYDLNNDGEIDIRIRPASQATPGAGSVTESGVWNGIFYSFTYIEGVDYFCVDDLSCVWVNGGARYTSGVNSSRFQALQIHLALSTSGGASVGAQAIVAVTDDGSVTSATTDPSFSIAVRSGVDVVLAEFSHAASITVEPGETLEIDQSVIQVDSYAYDLNEDGFVDGLDLDLMVFAIMFPGTLDVTDLTLEDAEGFRAFLTSPLLGQLDLDGAFLNGPEIMGDYDRDGVLEFEDYAALLIAFRRLPAGTSDVLGIQSNSPDYNALVDFDFDGVIRQDDVLELFNLSAALP